MVTEFLHHAPALFQQMVAPNLPSVSMNSAYLDPGTGSLITQIVIGVLVGGMVAAKMFWKRISGPFKSLFEMVSKRDKAQK
ncbi:MAG: hypothetical protein HY667_04235 [Chloroflexi bacterium]|nr:hypothetical protein [Chloroflexota bacterium]